MPKRHTIEAGDSVVKLSEEHGLYALTIWNHPDNAALKAERRHMNVLSPGDVVVIPDKVPKTQEITTGRKHTFRRKGIPAILRMQLFQDSQPRENQEYRLTIDGKTWTGTTDAMGVLTEYVPSGARKGEIVIGPDEFKRSLLFGEMNPISEVEGVKKRLKNLGYDPGELDAEESDESRAAILRFQRSQGLDETGEADGATTAKLEEIHDSHAEVD